MAVPRTVLSVISGAARALLSLTSVKVNSVGSMCRGGKMLALSLSGTTPFSSSRKTLSSTLSLGFRLNQRLNQRCHHFGRGSSRKASHDSISLLPKILLLLVKGKGSMEDRYWSSFSRCSGAAYSLKTAAAGISLVAWLKAPDDKRGVSGGRVAGMESNGLSSGGVAGSSCLGASSSG
jgi:hypothetical protein